MALPVSFHSCPWAPAGTVVSCGLRVALPHVAAAPTLSPTGSAPGSALAAPPLLQQIDRNAHPPHVTSYSLLMRNKWIAVLSAKGGGLIPTTAQAHIPEAAQCDSAGQKVHSTGLLCLDVSLLTQALWEGTLGAVPCPCPYHSPSCYGALDQALGVGRRAAKA